MLNKILLAFFCTLCFVSSAQADNANSPIGHWMTISDKTHDASAIIDLHEDSGKLQGEIIKIFPGHGRNPNEICTKCPGNFKDKRILGMTFLWGFVPQGDNSWGQGQILDPKEGEIYKCSMRLEDGGKKLSVRGYWGPFWRTQTWIRVK